MILGELPVPQTPAPAKSRTSTCAGSGGRYTYKIAPAIYLVRSAKLLIFRANAGYLLLLPEIGITIGSKIPHAEQSRRIGQETSTLFGSRCREPEMEGKDEKMFRGRDRRCCDARGFDLDIKQCERGRRVQRAVEIRGPDAQRTVACRSDEVPDHGVFFVIASHDPKALARAMALTR